MYTSNINQSISPRQQFTANLDISAYRDYGLAPSNNYFYTQPTGWEVCPSTPHTEVPKSIDIQIHPRRSAQTEEEKKYFYLEDLYKGGDKDFDDLIISSTGLKQKSKGVFQTSPDGKVKVDYLLDRGAYKGELAIFSLRGMDHLDRNSDEFREEAIKRAKSNSREGRIIVSDIKENGSLEGGRGARTFQFRPNDRVAFVFLGNSSFDKLDYNDKQPRETYFSTGSRDGFDHFRISSEPKNLSKNKSRAAGQLIETAREAKGVLA